MSGGVWKMGAEGQRKNKTLKSGWEKNTFEGQLERIKLSCQTVVREKLLRNSGEGSEGNISKEEVRDKNTLDIKGVWEKKTFEGG